ncbi:hypothetical protein GKO32_13100 [Amycolatopsis sp. RM579]|uniref:CoA transferase n=2 Tax=Amycolatopsis pithecellobii TaxID=664692 RepID=A0A6N7YSJ5_9PSEU|nr:hypothetical protein [Amycolatopsis pithecellobii]
MLTGRRDGPPLLCPGQPASVAWGALLATELLARVGGREVVLPGPRVLGERAAIAGFHRNAPWSADGTFRVTQYTVDSCAAPVVLNGLSREAVSSDRPMWTDRKRWRLPELLVADLSSGWAGPLCGHILTLLGARVLKIEDPGRPDTARSGPREFFDLLHSGQESVALAPEKAVRLIEAADVVIDDVLVDPPVIAKDKCWLRITGGSGDEDAVAAGLVAYDHGVPACGDAGGPAAPDDGALAAQGDAAGRIADDRGGLAPCGDAIAAPLTGVNAALTAVACRLGGGWWFAELSQRAQAAATLTGSLDGGFRVDAAPPVARRPAGRAAPLGAHTAQVLHEFG